MEPTPDYGDDHSDETSLPPASQQSESRHGDSAEQQVFSFDYASPPKDILPHTSRSPSLQQAVAVPMPHYDEEGSNAPLPADPSPGRCPPPPLTTDPPVDYEELPADYDDSPDPVEVGLAIATVAAASEGAENLAFVADIEDDVHMVAQPRQEGDIAEIETTGSMGRDDAELQQAEPYQTEDEPQEEEIEMTTVVDLTEVGAAVAAEDAISISVSTQGEGEGTAHPQVLMAPEILAEADVGELLGRMTEDGHLLSSRPHHGQLRQRHKTMAHGEIGQQLDELYRQQIRNDGTQLLKSSTVKLTGFQKWKFEQAKAWKKSTASAKEALADFTIWNTAFKDIEARFGSPVLAYFRFLKWLFFLNLLLALIILGVVILPQVIMHPLNFDTYLEDSRFTGDFADQARNCSASYTTHVNIVIQNSSVVFAILDFIQGTGWMEQTPVFIGYYFNRTYTNIINSHTVQYNMSVGYLLAILAYFLTSLFLMVRFTAQGMKSQITSTSDQFYKACNKVFCGWDFSLAEKRAVIFKHNQLYQEYLRDIDVQRRKERRKNQTRGEKCQMFSIRVLVNLLVFAILGASGYLIYYMSVESIKWLTEKSIAENPFLKLFVEFVPSLTITFLNFIVPLIFQKLVLLEGYSPTLEIKITIIRSVILRLASVAVLVLGVGSRLLKCETDKECNTCPEVTRCWETYFGQQFYKLVLLDFVTVVLMTFFVQFPRNQLGSMVKSMLIPFEYAASLWFIVAKFQNVKLFKIIGYQEFEIPKEVLDIVYTQTLCWIGGFVSPIIFCMTVMKMFLFFYIKRVALLNTCIPSTRLFRASNSQSFFMSMLLLSFILCALPVAFAIGKIPPSKSCSPFRLYSTEEYFMFSAIIDLISEWPGWLQNFIAFITSWTFYLPLIIVICLLIYFYVSVAAGKRKHIRILLEQLALEGKDKQYLLAQVREAIARGDFKKTE